jgi:quercetin dioxygenase-like cupin family protein
MTWQRILFVFVCLIVASFVRSDELKVRELVFKDPEEISWQPVEGVAGAKWKQLRTDPVTGAITAIVQFPAGAIEEPHHHTHGHMIYVLDGAKTVENKTAGKEFTLSTGMYLYTPPGNVHGIHYLTRCTFLFVTDGPFDMIWDKK